MTVHLEVGMTAIRRDGERVGPVTNNGIGQFAKTHGFRAKHLSYTVNGIFCGDGVTENENDIIAAGYPWDQLGAQVGDTVRCVWSGSKSRTENWVYTVDGSETPHPDSLYIIVKRATKPADRPRAAHKLNLHDGDVVELVGWQDRCKWDIGDAFTVFNSWLVDENGLAQYMMGSPLPKGHRPLFRVISRAAWAVDGMGGTIQQPDEVFTIHKRDKAYRITFPNGSDVGTVTREKL